ncbi:MAG TPA: hypothetical protein VFB20_04800 [Burkholderiales bacterium]|nr:hypothetical protein [Burkholderiales bacterium]
MFCRNTAAAALAVAFAASAPAWAAEDAELQQIRDEIKALKDAYEARIKALEERLRQSQTTGAPVPQQAETTGATSQQQSEPAASQAAAPAPPAPGYGAATGTQSSANAFNPAISLILSGLYANLSNPGNQITGFHVPPGTAIGPGAGTGLGGVRGFSLTESELGIYANIDPYFYGGFNFAVEPDNSVETEEAFIQTIGLSHGLTVKAGRFFSGIGYLNEQHMHVWDFVDAPLAYQAFLGSQMNDDGVQLRWLAPTETFLEFGAEVGRGRNFPGSDRDKNGVGSSALFAHMGGDVGDSHSWRAGLSLLQTSPQDRQFDDTDLAGVAVRDSFTGTSRLWIADFVWKYAPNGNSYYTNFKLQGEYLRRSENGNVTYDINGASLGPSIAGYSSTQSGWYLQGVYQFMPYWRVGLRTEQLYTGSVDYGVNNAFIARPEFDPRKNSVMVDYSPSEFSRIRLQLAQDKSREEATDNQIFVQYMMSLGAHGAHQF